jgi:DNA-binding transcriptional MerR regulator
MKEADFLEWPDWVETEDVLEKLKITPRTLQRWRINGVIPYSRLNGRCYYRKSDIVSLLKNNYNREKGGQR